METEILTRLLEITLYSALILIAVLLFRAAFKKWLSPRLRQSMSRRGNCWDNAPQESFFGHMKEDINFDGNNHTEIIEKIEDWMDYYNNDRLQWELAKLSPNEYWNYVTIGEYPEILALQGLCPRTPEV